jgi:hypothetical protein
MRLLSFSALLMIGVGCSQGNFVNEKTFLLKTALKNPKAKFFKDFDIFNRQGINEIMGDTLHFPFFEYFRTSDTTFQLNLHRNDEYGLRVEEMVVPLGKQIVYTFHDINDGPRHYYAKIVGDTIIRFNYREIKPNDFHAISDDNVMYYDIIPAHVGFG